MTDQPLKSDEQVVDQPVIKKGIVTTMFQDRRALKAPAPLWFILTMDTIIELNTGSTGLIACFNGISDHMRNSVLAILAAASFVCFRLKNVIGVIPKKQDI